MALVTPTGLTKVESGEDYATFSWTDENSGTADHVIYYQLASDDPDLDDYFIAGELGAGTNEFTLGGLANPESYRFRVTAYNSEEETDLSAALVIFVGVVDSDAAVGEDNPPQSESSGGGHTGPAFGAAVGETSPPQSESVASSGPPPPSGAVGEQNPAQSESIAATFIGLATGAVGEENPPQSESSGVTFGAPQGAEVGEDNPGQSEEVGGPFGFFLNAAAGEQNPGQQDFIQSSFIPDPVASVSETNPLQSESITELVEAFWSPVTPPTETTVRRILVSGVGKPKRVVPSDEVNWNRLRNTEWGHEEPLAGDGLMGLYANVGEHGFALGIDAGRFVPNVASAEIRFQKPGGQVISHTSVALDTNRIYAMTVPEGLLDRPGRWRAQLVLTLTNGRTITRKVEFDVGSTLVTT